MANNDQELKNIDKEVQFYLYRVHEHPGTSKQDSMSEQNITVTQKEQDSFSDTVNELSLSASEEVA